MALLDGRRTFFSINSKYPYGINTNVSINTDKGSAGYYWIKNKRFASILDYANGMLVNVVGNDIKDMYDIQEVIKEVNINFMNKIQFNFNETIPRELFRKSSHEKQHELLKKRHLTEGEVSSIDLLHKYCVNEKLHNRNSYILYFHSKGGCCIRRGQQKFAPMPVAAWREMMNTYTIEFPSICSRSLLDGYLACGYNSQDSSFSGNFFWSDCDHVAKLPSILPFNQYDAWAAEFFVFNISKSYGVRLLFGSHCGYSPYNCDEDHYKTECARNEAYEKRLNNFVSDKQLPENMGMIKVKSKYKDIIQNWTSINNSFCHSLGHEPFEQNQYFSSNPSVFVNYIKKLHRNTTV